jgi:hypothetical protein
MSHFVTNSKANIVDKKAFIAACKELGLTSVQENVNIKDYYGKVMKVDVAVACGKYHIGLLKNATGKFDMVADWWGIRCSDLPKEFKEVCKSQNMTDQDIQDCVLRYTTKNTIVNKYRLQGYACKVVDDKTGQLQVTMTKF